MNALQLEYCRKAAMYQTLKAADRDADDTWKAFDAMYDAGNEVIAWAKGQLPADRLEKVTICFTPNGQRNPANRQRLIDICMRLEA